MADSLPVPPAKTRRRGPSPRARLRANANAAFKRMGDKAAQGGKHTFPMPTLGSRGLGGKVTVGPNPVSSAMAASKTRPIRGDSNPTRSTPPMPRPATGVSATMAGSKTRPNRGPVSLPTQAKAFGARRLMVEPGPPKPKPDKPGTRTMRRGKNMSV